MFFSLFICIGVWFFLNLLFGVIFSNFIEYRLKYKHKYLNEDQIKWIDVQHEILKMKPELKIERKKSYYRQKLNSFLINRTFQFILKLCVFLNVVCLAIYYDEAPLAYRTFLKITGTIFAFIYTLEAILKIVAFGFKAYFSNSIYVFEFLLACFYILDSLTEFIFLPDFYTSIDQQSLYLIRISRIFRLLPLFRLIQYLKGVFKIFKTLSMSFSLLFHLFFLLLLTYFIYAVIGCFFLQKSDPRKKN